MEPPDAVEIRVLGCLIEKQRTTPDVYPLSLNSLRLACNQATNRDPVVEYDEPTIRDALQRLALRRWTRLASDAGSRATKYRHLLDETLTVKPPEISVLAVLMLRGAQTPGELKARTDRLFLFASLADLQETLEGLAERRLVQRLERRPGQKEERWVQLLGGAAANSGERVEPMDGPAPAKADRLTELEERVRRLEEQIATLIPDRPPAV
jgi:uncharacterized protein YceH (UPF0502 family)